MTDDEKLIWRIKHLSSGDARDKLVRKYYDQIYAYVYRHILNVDDSLDLTQDIFVKAINALPSFDKKKSSFKTWLYTIRCCGKQSIGTGDFGLYQKPGLHFFSDYGTEILQ